MEKRSNNKFYYEQAEELILQKQLTDVYQSGFSANEEKTKKDKKKP
ncbi:hypothetical protein [Bacillus taeanensis]|nr:hypothetical protein [Bacillus taeanensis]